MEDCLTYDFVYEKGQIIIDEKMISNSAILKPKISTMSSYICLVQ